MVLQIYILMVCSFFLDILRKLGFQKETIKENSIDEEEEEIPEA